jgi:hypothetical protein
MGRAERLTADELGLLIHNSLKKTVSRYGSHAFDTFDLFYIESMVDHYKLVFKYMPGGNVGFKPNRPTTTAFLTGSWIIPACDNAKFHNKMDEVKAWIAMCSFAKAGNNRRKA